MKREHLRSTAIVAAALLLSACGGGGNPGGSSGSGGTSSTPPPPSATITGTAAKGLLLNAIVTYYSVVNGQVGTTALGTTRTDATTGDFSSTVSNAGPVVAVITVDSSTHMLDEISGTSIAAPAGLTLHAVFDGVTNLQPLAVTPLTETAYDLAVASSGGLTTANIDAANSAVGQTFLNGASILSTLPITLANYSSAGVTPAQQAQAKLLTALAVAANAGTATNASGQPCTGSYAANVVCLISGLGQLISLSSSGAPTPTASANYVVDAYSLIDNGMVTVNGGQSASALGLNVSTPAETTLTSSVAAKSSLSGYGSTGNAVADTKALIANIRTNILDQGSEQTFGVNASLLNLSADYNQNAGPVLASTIGLVSALYRGTQLVQLGTTSAWGAPSPLISTPLGMAIDSAGNVYVSMYNNTIVKISGGNVSLYAGQPGVAGSANGPANQATFKEPTGLAVDAAGNLYVVDSGNFLLRKIAVDGTVSTLAGNGVASTLDGQGTDAGFNLSTNLTIGDTVLHVSTPLGIDGNGNLYLTSFSNSGASTRVRPGHRHPGDYTHRSRLHAAGFPHRRGLSRLSDISERPTQLPGRYPEVSGLPAAL